MTGRVIAGRFVLEKRVGRGGMGEVYLANHLVLKRPFAVKLLRSEFVSHATSLARFFREARVASSVDHPNIVSIYDYGQTERNEPYLIMEYVEGATLLQVARSGPARCLHPALAMQLLAQVAHALHHAHERGVIHRDIKPENVLITTWQGQANFVKVLDFGVARIVGQPPLTRVGEELLGTPEFMAPELYTSPEFTQAVDLYALGVMLFDAIVGETPFRGDLREVMAGHVSSKPPLLSARRKDIKIPPALDELAARLMAKHPADRPTAQAAAQALEEILATLPSHRPQLTLSVAVHAATDPVGTAGAAVPSPGPLPTVVLPASAVSAARETGSGFQGTVILSKNTLRMSDLLQIADPARRAEIDALESEINQLAIELAEQVEQAGKACWGTQWPDDIYALRRRIHSAIGREEECAEQIRGRRQFLAQVQEMVDQHRRELRQQILELSDRLQAGIEISSPERQQIVADIESCEQTLGALLLESAPTQDPEITRLTQLVRDTQSELRRGWSALANRVIDAVNTQASQAESGHQISRLLGQIDEARSMLTILMQASPKRTP